MPSRDFGARARELIPDATSQVIVESWERSRQAGLDPRAGPDLRFVAPEEVERRAALCSAWLGVASSHLAWITRWLATTRHVAYLVDRDGVLLVSMGDSDMAKEVSQTPGFDWSERVMGTNGVGTALVADRPVAVLGREHYMTAYTERSCMGAPVHGASGELIGAIGLSTSVGDCSPELLGLLAHTAHTIDQEVRARELPIERRLREAAELQRNAREELLATVAHDIRSPMATVTLGTAMVRGALERSNVVSAGIERALDRVRSASTRVEHLVRDLLDFTSLEAGTLSVDAGEDDIVKVVEEAVELMQPIAEGKGVRLSARTSPPVSVLHDPSRLSRVLLNLISNAIKFTPAGGHVTVEAEIAGDDARVTVSDDGTGIPAKVLSGLFDPQRNDAQRKADSYGLGLRICRGIVEAHGGRIWAESEEGKGSAFHFTIPLGTTRPPSTQRT